MAGTTIWKGVITFHEVSVAVKLHSAVKQERIELHLLHRSDLVRLRQQMLCAYEKKPVPSEEQVKGFEVEPGKYLLVDPKELEEATAQASRLIEVHAFVPRQQIDPLFFDRVYTLEPDTLAQGYGDLAEALEETGAAGLCTWSMRKRSYFGALLADRIQLRLVTLHYADEVLPVAALELPEIEVSAKELQVGKALLDQLSGSFAPEQFVNDHEQKLRQMIEKKTRGEKIAVIPPNRRKPTDSDQLLRVLEASLKQAA